MGNKQTRIKWTLDFTSTVVKEVIVPVVVPVVQFTGKVVATAVVDKFDHKKQFQKLVPIELPSNNQNLNQRIHQIRIRSSWLGKNSALAQLASGITGSLTAMSATHWFIQIQTDDVNIWYIAHLNIDKLQLKQFTNQHHVDFCGSKSGGNYETQSITTKALKFPANRNMNQVKNWVESSNNYYHLGCHNCQHWAQEFFDWI